MTERVLLLEFLNISKTISFPVNTTVIEENAVIRTRLALMGGIFIVTQHWYMSDSTNGSRDETLLEDHFEFTTARILSRFVKTVASGAHNTMLKNIRQHFMEAL